MNRIPELPESSISAGYINEEIQRLKGIGLHVGLVSDGYHTFDELYEHRIANFRLVCKYVRGAYNYNVVPVWKSKLHSDGSVYEGWFIAGIDTVPGKQITYHIPMSQWDKWPAMEYKQAPEWDGHTSADVLKRLAEL